MVVVRLLGLSSEPVGGGRVTGGPVGDRRQSPSTEKGSGRGAGSLVTLGDFRVLNLH